MRNVTGQVARGDDFFDRESEQARYWRDLETDNLLLLAPRRVGKTSLMQRMRETAADHGYQAVFLDVSDAGDESAFVRRLYTTVLESDLGEGLWNRVKDSWLGKTITRVKKIGGAGFSIEFDAAGSTDWTRLGRELADALSQLDGRWLIQIDELPVFVLKLLQINHDAGRIQAREFLYWMRRLRLDYPKVRWMLAGSIGLDTVAARLNMADVVNDLHIVQLDAYAPAAAHGLLLALSREYQIDLSEPVRNHILTRVGWPVPYYLQLIFHELRNLDEAWPITAVQVDNAVERLLDPARRNYFDYWRQRLHDELGRPDSDHAIVLLNAVCRDPGGVSRDTLSQTLAPHVDDADARADKLRYLLDVLQGDGYLVEYEKRWRFRFPLLREFWLLRVAP